MCCRTNPGFHHVSLPVELQEGRVLIQLGLPLSRCPLQLRHFASQRCHLGTDVVYVVVVLFDTNTTVRHVCISHLLFDCLEMSCDLFDQFLSISAHVIDSVSVHGEVRLKCFVLLQQAL